MAIYVSPESQSSCTFFVQRHESFEDSEGGPRPTLRFRTQHLACLSETMARDGLIVSDRLFRINGYHCRKALLVVVLGYLESGKEHDMDRRQLLTGLGASASDDP